MLCASAGYLAWKQQFAARAGLSFGLDDLVLPMGTDSESSCHEPFVAGTGYQYGWGDLMFAYRRLDYDFKSDPPLRATNISGPALCARLFF